MRRKDREISDIEEIFDMLLRCDTVRLGIQGNDHPYVVPLSFGAELVNGKPIVYFHCAEQGLKLDMLNENPNVCIEGDIFIKTEMTAHGITARYESVIGFGICRFAEDEEEILHGLRLMTEHYGYNDYPLERCQGLQHLKVGVIELDAVTGKRNLPGVLTAADMAAARKTE